MTRNLDAVKIEAQSLVEPLGRRWSHLQNYLPTGDEYVRGAQDRMRALFADAV